MVSEARLINHFYRRFAADGGQRDRYFLPIGRQTASRTNFAEGKIHQQQIRRFAADGGYYDSFQP